MPPPTTARSPDWQKEFEKAMRDRANNGDPKHPWWNPNPIARTLEIRPCLMCGAHPERCLCNRNQRLGPVPFFSATTRAN